jgi:hypothetical protein
VLFEYTVTVGLVSRTNDGETVVPLHPKPSAEAQPKVAD